MSMNDPIADMLTRIRNSLARRAVLVSMPSSTVKIAITKVLEVEGYISGYTTEVKDGKVVLNIRLKYHEGEAVIQSIKRVSRPGLRVYRKASEIPKVIGGLGVTIVSTPKGVMTDRGARSAGVGGEVICSVY